MPMFSGFSQWFPATCTLCALNTTTGDKSLCNECANDLPWCPQTIALDQLTVFAACHYQYPIDRLIHLFKYQHRLDLLPMFRECLASIAKPMADAIVPMPISSPRLKERGFNQSLLLAKEAAKLWNLPVWQPIGRHHRLPQQGLSRSERLLNLEDAFYPLPHQQRHLANSRVVIMDDVVTTGSSVIMLSHALKALGIEETKVACLAIANFKL